MASAIIGFIKFGLCLLALFVTVPAFPTSTTTGTTSASDSCYQLGVGGNANIGEHIEYLENRTEELWNQAESVKSYIFRTYNFHPLQESSCNKTSVTKMFIGGNENRASGNGVTGTPSQNLLKHYRLLDLHKRYLDSIVSNGVLLDQDPNIVEELRPTYSDIESANCTLLTALAKLGVEEQEVREDKYTLNENLTNHEDPLERERLKACVIVNDLRNSMKYLNQVYDDMIDVLD